jgi:hypothetical protein
MKKPVPYEGGSLFTIRFPNTTPKIVLDTLNALREEYGKGFTSKIIEMWHDLFLEGKPEKKPHHIYLEMPGYLTEEQRKTLESKEFQDILNSLAYFLLTKTITPTLQHAPIFYGGIPSQQEQIHQASPASYPSPPGYHEEAASKEQKEETTEEISTDAMDFALKNLFDDGDD